MLFPISRPVSAIGVRELSEKAQTAEQTTSNKAKVKQIFQTEDSKETSLIDGDYKGLTKVITHHHCSHFGNGLPFPDVLLARVPPGKAVLRAH